MTAFVNSLDQSNHLIPVVRSGETNHDTMTIELKETDLHVLDLCTGDHNDSFRMGQLFEKMINLGLRAWLTENGIRIPLVKTDDPALPDNNDIKTSIEILLDDWTRRLETAEDLLKKEHGKESAKRVVSKAAVYKAIVLDLERVMETINSHLH